MPKTCACCSPPGASRAQIEDARAIGFAGNINRLADAFEFPIPDARAFDVSA